ncbi:MAG: hypothetical protein U0905_15235 [Pirellulales bacterium]
MRQFRSMAFFAACCLGGIFTNGTVQAQDPAFGFLYGYSLGQARAIRTHLPAPPYFAVHPPVYYGERYARPYGDSPYASWPTLQANPNFRPEPIQDRTQTILNPHAGQSGPAPTASFQPVAQGKKVVIINPYAMEAESRVAAK